MKEAVKVVSIVIGIIMLQVGICILMRKPYISLNTNQKEQNAVDSLIKLGNLKEAQFAARYDSVKAENSALKQANILINKSIVQILKTNEKSKTVFFNSNDSVKHFICDSILRANGYR